MQISAGATGKLFHMLKIVLFKKVMKLSKETLSRSSFICVQSVLAFSAL
jgi:hypothetical protein